MIDPSITPHLIVGGAVLFLTGRLGWRVFQRIITTTFDKSASVLPYAITTDKVLGISKNQAFFWISRETNEPWKGKWSDFGGCCSSGESFYKTAAREGAEESKGLLGTRLSLLKRIRKSPSIFYKKIYQEFPEERSLHHLFFLRVDSSFLEKGQLHDIINNVPHDFEERCPDWEKDRGYWISTEDLLNAIKTSGKFNVANSIEELRPSFFQLLQTAEAQRVIEQIEMDDSCLPHKTYVERRVIYKNSEFN